MLRTSFAVAFDGHKKGPEEGLSCALLGGAVLGDSVASAQGWVPARAHSIACAWTPLSTPGRRRLPLLTLHLSELATGRRPGAGAGAVCLLRAGKRGRTGNWCIMTVASIGPLYRR